MTIKNETGITIIELLIVISVFVILFFVTLPQFSKIREENVVKSAVSSILSAMDKARVETLSSLNSSEYGVHFEQDKIVIFKGKVFIESEADNEIIDILYPAVISNITLGGVSGTSGDVYFNRLSGSPSGAGTVTVSSPNFSKVITISGTGGTSVN